MNTFKNFLMTATAALILLTSCTKESAYDCGTIIDGYTEFDSISNRLFFVLRVSYPDITVNEYVSEFTWVSYGPGDEICLY